ncbi:MAG: hypothetical protein E7617_06780 [Ruminococcaceae bacterium]|nr:hypothetical protein [Oscillospiraceae bacterium]
MKIFGTVLWNILGGFLLALSMFLCGIIFCATIVFIPIGIPCFRLAKLVICPFEKQVDISFDEHPVLNVIWLILGGLEMVATYYLVGAILCVTIIGIPFGRQFFKLGKFSIAPYGASVE